MLGALTVNKSGHALHHKLAAKVLADASSYEIVTVRVRPGTSDALEFDELAFAPTAA